MKSGLWKGLDKFQIANNKKQKTNSKNKMQNIK